MIVVDLVCGADHRFEAWFASHESFSAQRAQNLVTCPICGDTIISRIPSAPHVARPVIALQKPPEPTPANDLPAAVAALAAALHKHIAECEDVGERFATEVRKMHYGDADERAIRGIATTQEAMELIDEGISILPMPPLKEDLH